MIPKGEDRIGGYDDLRIKDDIAVAAEVQTCPVGDHHVEEVGAAKHRKLGQRIIIRIIPVYLVSRIQVKPGLGIQLDGGIVVQPGMGKIVIKDILGDFPVGRNIDERGREADGPLVDDNGYRKESDDDNGTRGEDQGSLVVVEKIGYLLHAGLPFQLLLDPFFFYSPAFTVGHALHFQIVLTVGAVFVPDRSIIDHLAGNGPWTGSFGADLSGRLSVFTSGIRSGALSVGRGRSYRRVFPVFGFRGGGIPAAAPVL